MELAGNRLDSGEAEWGGVCGLGNLGGDRRILGDVAAVGSIFGESGSLMFSGAVAGSSIAAISMTLFIWREYEVRSRTGVAQSAYSCPLMTSSIP